jgi:acetyltransferase-like isoleucine patch superfamily enzyme
MKAQKQIDSEEWTGLHQTLFSGRKSNMRKYQEMVVGHEGWGALLRYEVTQLLVSQIPGALGLVLRKFLYRALFKSVGRNVVFGRNVTLRHPHKITIGDNVIIDDDCLLDAKGESNQGIVIGDFVTIGRFSSLVCKNGDIRIASHVNLGSSVKLVIAKGATIEIGDQVDIGSSCHFSGGSYDYSQIDLLPSSRRIQAKGIIVEELSWIGVGAILLDGVRIGSKSIIGAGSVVNKEIPPYSVAVGVPAKVIKKRLHKDM